MAVCKGCGEEAEQLVTVKVAGKGKKLCEDCADRAREAAEVAEESEAVVQQMMGFKGRRLAVRAASATLRPEQLLRPAGGGRRLPTNSRRRCRSRVRSFAMEMDPRAVRKESERTMRYMILIAASETSRKELDEASGPELAAAYRRYTEELRKAGVLLGGDALHTSERGARVGVTNGRRSVTDGPFSEAKEVVGGYFLIQVKSKEEAIEWAARCPAAQYAPRSYCEVREIIEFPTNLRPPSADLEESPS